MGLRVALWYQVRHAMYGLQHTPCWTQFLNQMRAVSLIGPLIRYAFREMRFKPGFGLFLRFLRRRSFVDRHRVTKYLGGRAE